MRAATIFDIFAVPFRTFDAWIKTVRWGEYDIKALVVAADRYAPVLCAIACLVVVAMMWLKAVSSASNSLDSPRSSASVKQAPLAIDAYADPSARSGPSRNEGHQEEKEDKEDSVDTDELEDIIAELSFKSEKGGRIRQILRQEGKAFTRLDDFREAVGEVVWHADKYPFSGRVLEVLREPWK